MSDKKRKVRITEEGYARVTEERHVKLDCLTEEELHGLHRLLLGLVRMEVQDGRMIFHDIHEPLPPPTHDEDMLPFWRRYDGRQLGVQLRMFDEERMGEYSSPCIIIQQLCGYCYSPDNYRAQASKLESYGFVCMRSARDEDGRFAESWYLPGLWFAKGALKEAVDGIKPANKQTEKAVSFLCHNVQFGSLDVCVQYAAMVIDD